MLVRPEQEYTVSPRPGHAGDGRIHSYSMPRSPMTFLATRKHSRDWGTPQ